MNAISSVLYFYNLCPISRTVIIKWRSVLLILHPTPSSQFQYFHQALHPRPYNQPPRTISHPLCRYDQKLETQQARSAKRLPKFPMMTMTWNEKKLFRLSMVQARPFQKSSCQSDQKFYLIHLNINDDDDVGGSVTKCQCIGMIHTAPVTACFRFSSSSTAQNFERTHVEWSNSSCYHWIESIVGWNGW